MIFATQGVVNILLASGALALLLVALYFLRSRQRQFSVRSLLFYRRQVERSRRRLSRSRLRRYYSLFWQLLILTSIILAILRPKIDSEGNQRVVIALDTSASMCRQQDSVTHLAWAKDVAEEMLASLGPEDEVAVITIGNQVTAKSQFLVEKSTIDQALVALQCDDTSRDMVALGQWSAGALVDHPNSSLVFLTDEALGQKEKQDLKAQGFVAQGNNGPKLRVVARKIHPLKKEHQLAITSFSARSRLDDLKSLETLVEITNLADEIVEAQIAIYRIDPDIFSQEQASSNAEAAPPYHKHRTLLEMKEVTLKGNQSQRLILRNLSRDSELLMAEVKAPSGVELFMADNVAYFALASRKKRLIQVVGKMSTYLEAALLLDPLFEIQNAPDITEFKDKCDLRIYLPGSLASPRAACAEVYLGAAPKQQEYPVSLGQEMRLVGFDEWDKGSPLFRFYDPYQIQILKAYRALPNEKQKVLGASAQGGLLVSGRRDSHAWVASTFLPEESDFVLRAAWPIFVHQLIDYLSPDGKMPELLGLKTGEAHLLPHSLTNAPRLQLKGPAGQVEAAFSEEGPESSTQMTLSRAGFYQVQRPQGFPYIAASLFLTREAQVSQMVADSPFEFEIPERSFAQQPLWFYFALCGLLLFLLEIIFFHRRWTL